MRFRAAEFAWPLGLGALLLTFAGGCSLSAPALSAAVIDEGALRTEDFRAAPQILEGFDPPAADSDWRVGDRALYGVRLERDGRRTVRLVLVTLKSLVLPPDARIEVVPEGELRRPRADGVIRVTHAHLPRRERDRRFVAKLLGGSFSSRHAAGWEHRVERTSFHVLVAVDVFDEAGGWLETSFALAPEAHLRGGMFTITDLWLQLRERYGPEFVDHVADSPEEYARAVEAAGDLVFTIIALRDTLWSCPNLEPLLEAVTPRPSLGSLLLRWQVQLALDVRYGDLGPAPPGVAAGADGRRVLTLPLDVQINDESLMRCDLLVAESRPPLLLCGGVVGIDASLTQAPRRLTVRVLAARRGPAPQRPEPATQPNRPVM